MIDEDNTNLRMLEEAGHLVWDGNVLRFPPWPLVLRADEFDARMAYWIRILAQSHRTRTPVFDLPHNDGILTLDSGVKFRIPLDHPFYFVHMITIDDTFIQGEYAWLQERMAGKRVLDIGAYIGDTAMAFVQSGAEMVYACEPDPEFFAQAQKNLAMNRTPRARLFCLGVGELGVHEVTPLPYTILSSPVQADLVPLSTLLQRWAPIQILKMDCEGCEHEAIGSLCAADCADLEAMMIECHAFSSRDPQDVVTAVQGLGFETRVEYRQARQCPDLLYAWRS